MFKKGDIVVCIDTQYAPKLVLYERYQIFWYNERSHIIRIIHNFNNLGDYSDYRFVTLAEYRKMKINKICLKLEI